MWDAQWDYHMRRVVFDMELPNELDTERLVRALAAARCTTLVEAKARVQAPDPFNTVPANIRSSFIAAVRAADPSAGTFTVT